MREKRLEFDTRAYTSDSYAKDDVGRLHAEADRLASSGLYAGAIAAYTEVIESRPLCEAYTNRGACYVKIGDYGKAVGDFSFALSAWPRHELSYVNYNNRGHAHENMKSYDLAIADFDEALRLNPRYAEAWFNRAETLRQMGKSAEAIASYVAFLPLATPESIPFHTRLVGDARRRISELRNPGSSAAPRVPEGYDQAMRVLFGDAGYDEAARALFGAKSFSQQRSPNRKAFKIVVTIVLLIVVILILLVLTKSIHV
jgi:tetratricopeptide (TPR) repeat protein